MQVLANLWDVITQANTNHVIAAFTVVIGVTTVIYTLMTLRLFKLSRWAFLVDVLIRMAHHTQEREERYLRELTGELNGTIEQLSGAGTGKLKETKIRWEELKALVETGPYLMGLSEAIEGINKKLGIDLSKAFIDYIEKASKGRKDIKRRMESFRTELVRRGVKTGGKGQV